MLNWRSLTQLSRASREASRALTRSLRTSAKGSCLPEALERRQMFTVTLASHTLANIGGNGNSGESSISADGRYIVFRSAANDLVAGDTNGVDDIFRLDTQTGTITLVSAGFSGALSNGASSEPSVSADGRYVGFRSAASNLTNPQVDPDFNTKDDIFLRDMQQGTTQLVSKNSDHTNSANEFSAETFVSSDGRFVAFSSFASNIVPNDTNERVDSFLWDRTTGRTVLLSATPGGAVGNERSFDPTVAVGGNGQVFTSFRSLASDLVANDGNGKIDVFARSLVFDGQGNVTSATTQLASVNVAGASGNGDSTSNSISSTGRYVVFRSSSSDLVSAATGGVDDNNNADDVFLRDLVGGTTRILSVNRLRTGSANGVSGEPSVSTDGRFAAFTSSASNIVANDTNGRSDIFFTDLSTGNTVLLSLNLGASAGGNGRSFDPFVSSNGQFVSFSSFSSDLAAGVTSGTTLSNVFRASTTNVEAGPDNPPTDNDNDGTPDPQPTPQQAPTAAIDGANLPPITGAATYDFKVNLADNNALDVVNVGDLQVVLPDGVTVVTASRVRVVGSGATAKVTYRIPAPGGTWTPAANGSYTVRAPANAIKDAAGNALAAGNIGTLAISVAPPESANLVPTIAAKLPATQIAGAKTKAAVSVLIANQGQTAVSGPITTTLYLSTDGELDEADVQVGSIAKALKLAPGKGKAVKAKLVLPANIDDGQYVVLARVDSANAVVETNEFDNFVASANSMAVAKPFVDLVPTAGSLTGTLTASGKGVALVTLRNNGNTQARGVVSVGLVASTNGVLDDVDDIALGTAQAKVSLKPGQAKVFKLKLTLPANLAAGTYVLGAKLSGPSGFSDSNADNDTSLSASQFVVS